LNGLYNTGNRAQREGTHHRIDRTIWQQQQTTRSRVMTSASGRVSAIRAKSPRRNSVDRDP
jgi:hypothetical protein